MSSKCIPDDLTGVYKAAQALRVYMLLDMAGEFEGEAEGESAAKEFEDKLDEEIAYMLDNIKHIDRVTEQTNGFLNERLNRALAFEYLIEYIRVVK